MAELVPSIIAKDFSDFQQKCSSLEGRVERAHLDVVDGKFAPNVSWGDPGVLRDYKTSLAIEAHLMVESPEASIEEWTKSCVARIVYHYESTDAHQRIIETCQNAGKEVGAALLPHTPITVLEEWLERINFVLLLEVNPGFYGSPLHGEFFERISTLHKLHPNLTIEVDGGMNPETARRAVEAGADLIVCGSYIFGSEDPEKAIEEMKKAIRGYSH